MYLCNRVVRSSKAQHISEFALSLNRYYKIETLLFCSDTQLDTFFCIIPCKDTKNYFAIPRELSVLSFQSSSEIQMDRVTEETLFWTLPKGKLHTMPPPPSHEISRSCRGGWKSARYSGFRLEGYGVMWLGVR